MSKRKTSQLHYILIASRRGSSKNAQLTAQLKAVIKDCLRLLPSINQTSPETPSHFVAVSTEVSNSIFVSPAPEAPVSSFIVWKK